MKLRRAELYIIASVAVLACGVITIPLDPTAPTNTCSDDTTCATEYPDGGVHCKAGACVGASSFSPILVISVPFDQPNIGGYTFGLSGSDNPQNSYQHERIIVQSPPNCQGTSAECDFLPPLTVAQNGYLQASQGLGIALWPPGGLEPNINKDPQSSTTLPVDVLFHPKWRDPATGNYLLASKLGLPLSDIHGTLLTASKDVANGSVLTAPTNADASVPGFVFRGNLAQAFTPNDPTQYDLEMDPVAPFVVFPPYFVNVSMTPGSPTVAPLEFFNLRLLLIDFQQPPLGDVSFNPVEINGPITGYTMQADVGAPSLAGWSAYVVDADGRRVTSIVTLTGAASQNVTLYDGLLKYQNVPTDAGPMSEKIQQDQTGQVLYFDPPPNVDLPRYFQTAGGVPPASIGPSNEYRALPEAGNISGFVLRPDGVTKTTAQIVFYANGDTSGPYVIDINGNPQANLLYQKNVQTTSLGEYPVTLPPGTYTAYVVPDDPDLALTVIPNQVVLANVVGTQGGHSLVVNMRTHVRGRAVLPNGTPLVGADIYINASADLPLTKGTDQITRTDDPRARPREAHGTTGGDGSFDVLSDPGLVDISIRPHDGTNYPWVVLTSRTVPIAPSGMSSDAGDAGIGGALTLGTIAIPPALPYQQTPPGQLADSLGNAIPRAVVRAYAFPPAVTNGDAGAPTTRAARLIGMTVTDNFGLFQLFVTPPDPQ